MSELFCNGCWTAIKPGEAAVSTSCAHLFCASCSPSLIQQSGSGSCPCCQSVLTAEAVKQVQVLVDVSHPCDKLALAGQSTETAVSMALAAIQFNQRQSALYEQVRLQQQQQRTARMETQCKKKLTDVHNAYKSAKRKYEEVLKHKEAAEAENRELRDKYNHKAGEAKTLRSHIPELQHENGALKQALEQMSRQSGIPLHAVPALHGRFGSAGGGGGGGGGISNGNNHLVLSSRHNNNNNNNNNPNPSRSVGSPRSGIDRLGATPPTRPLINFPNASPLASPAFTPGGPQGGYDYLTPNINLQRGASMHTGVPQTHMQPQTQLGMLPAVSRMGGAPGGGGNRRDSLLVTDPTRRQQHHVTPIMGQQQQQGGAYGMVPRMSPNAINGYGSTLT